MSIKPALQLQFAGSSWAATAPPAAERCTCHHCAWQGAAADVLDLNSIGDWVDCQDTTDVVILPEGECPECRMPVYNAAAEMQLARLREASLHIAHDTP